MSCQSRTDRDIGSFKIANLSDHDDVRTLPHDVAQPCGKRETDLRIHVYLIDAVHLILDRILDCNDLANRTINALQGAIERGALAAAGRPRDEKYPMGLRGHLADLFVQIVWETQAPKINQRRVRAVKNTHDNALSIHRRQRRDTKVDFF